MNTPETDVIGGPYIEREGDVQEPIMSFKELSDTMFYQRYANWLWFLSPEEQDRRERISKQQLDNSDSGSILDA